MAAFELNIYGKNDEIVNTYATDKVRWGVFLEALKVQESLSSMTSAEQFEVINRFVKKIFPELTERDLENADINDVMNLFTQLIRKANAIGGGSKNAIGVG